MSLRVFNPTVGHEIMTTLGAVLWGQKPDDVEFGGTCLMPLSNGGKSPDFSIFSDDHLDPENRFQRDRGTGQITGFPTVVIEVGYSEKPRNLAEDCGRWIVCSLGRVRLAIGINIDYTLKTDKETGELDRTINSIDCFTWEIKKVDKDVQAAPGERINILTRADGKKRGAATQYSCLSLIDKKLYRFHSWLCHTYRVQLYYYAINISNNLLRCFRGIYKRTRVSEFKRNMSIGLVPQIPMPLFSTSN